MTADRMSNPTPAPRNGNALLHDLARPFPERVAEAVRAWDANDRDPAHLVDGKAFLALYCWQLAATRRGEEPDEATAAFVERSHDSIGGRHGWAAMLHQRATCSCHGTTWRLENISLCLGCLRYVCYELDGPCCAGAEIVG
ncbi:hypothetical protein [Kitasatospora sp. NPDC056181]|uniref:hypothetical protein n=1 Tax=Kitasatospora sp. NPDC056181 TaxID=3345737 RepID=UPI0035E04870